MKLTTTDPGGTAGASAGVPLVDLRTQHWSLQSKIIVALREVFASSAFVLGPNVSAFEAEMAAFLGVEHAIGTASGTDALTLSLMALGISPGDEVLVPSFTAWTTEIGPLATTSVLLTFRFTPLKKT